MVADGVDRPVAVRFDQGGVLHVLSLGPEGRVTRIDLHGTGSRTLITSGVVGLDNAAFDAENRMFVSSYASGGITEMRPDGRTRVIVPRGFDGPYGVTVGRGGTVYAADHYGVASPPATTVGSRAGDAPEPAVQVLAPFVHGIVADGDLLHLTSQFGDVRTYDPGHGRMRARAGGLNRPMGIAVGAGRLAGGRRVGRRQGAGRRRRRPGHRARGGVRPPRRRGLRRGGPVLRQRRAGGRRAQAGGGRRGGRRRRRARRAAGADGPGRHAVHGGDRAPQGARGLARHVGELDRGRGPAGRPGTGRGPPAPGGRTRAVRPRAAGPRPPLRRDRRRTGRLARSCPPTARAPCCG